jgi:hypothetical protein
MFQELVKPVLMTAVLIFIAATSAAQTQPRDVPGGPGCPERGVEKVGPKWNGSDAGTSCNSGVGFTFAGITYTAQDNRCPSMVEYVPTHHMPDHATHARCTYWFQQGTIQVLLHKYECRGPLAGCGFLGLGWCCTEVSVTEGPQFPDHGQSLCRPCRD